MLNIYLLFNKKQLYPLYKYAKLYTESSLECVHPFSTLQEF